MKDKNTNKSYEIHGQLDNGASISVSIDNGEIDISVGGYFLTTVEVSDISEEVAEEIKND